MKHVGWTHLRFDFRQRISGGYRYLDRCGEFMLEAERTLDLIPVEAKPSGAKLERPESGIVVMVDTSDIRITQESPDNTGEDFFHLCSSILCLSKNLFQPEGVDSNGFALKQYLPASSAEKANRMSLELLKNDSSPCFKAIPMELASKSLKNTFRSGSLELTVQLDPVVFERVGVQRYNYPFHASPTEVRRVDRLNRKADLNALQTGYAIMLSLDAVEYQPPPDRLDKHFAFFLEQRQNVSEAMTL